MRWMGDVRRFLRLLGRSVAPYDGGADRAELLEHRGGGGRAGGSDAPAAPRDLHPLTKKFYPHLLTALRPVGK